MGLGVEVRAGGEGDAELSGASQIEIDQRLGQMSSFRLTLPADIREGDIAWLADPRVDPGAEISVLIATDDGAACLIAGLVTGHQLKLVTGGDGSSVTVLGSDRAVEMSREEKVAQWANLKASDAVEKIVKSYGFTPDVDPTAAAWSEDNHALLQCDTDYAFVERLAERNGFCFWVTADAEETVTAHFKRLALDSEPASELVINLADPTLDELELEWDTERPTAAVVKQVSLSDKNLIDGSVEGSPQTPLSDLPLAEIVSGKHSLLMAVVGDDAGELTARGEGALIEASWFVTARCRTSLKRLGKLVRAGEIVNLRGVGSRHSGRYLVTRVTHTIDASAHTMDIELSRNAWGKSNAGGLF